MTQELPPIVLKGKELRKFLYLKRKYPVSQEFLHRNWANAKRFIIYALNPRCVLRIYAWRKRNNRVLLLRRARLLLFDPRLKRMIKRRKANVKQWSSSIVRYYKKRGQITEYEETEMYGEDLSKLMKEQLELLKSGKRGISLIEDANKNVELRSDRPESPAGQEEQAEKEVVRKGVEKEQVEAKQVEEMHVEEEAATAVDEEPVAKVPAAEPTRSKDSPAIAVVQPSSIAEKVAEKPSKKTGGSKFLDMLMNKVRVKNFAKESNFPKPADDLDEGRLNKPTTGVNSDFNFNDDTSEDFVGFDESAHQPGMLLTPLVPQNCKTIDGNGAFVSDALEAYMKKNNLRDTNPEDRELLLEPMYQDGRVTAHSMPPYMDMPAVPDSLQRLRTVADRRHYLQRSKNQKMAIINNEANIYRELQRKQRQRKVKIAAMQQLQSFSTQMPFTRQGWQAASYVATETDKYYYQVIRIDGEMVRLPGSQGNNVRREKQPHRSMLTEKELATLQCRNQCVDATLRKELKVLPTRQCQIKSKLQKLNQYPLPAIFRPCPLSQKPYQKPLDDDTAALLLAGGSMAVVSMPTVQLDVKPQLGRPLDEIAKRYLQYILPHHDITREWAEFSVSTLQESPNSMREAEAQAAAAQATNAGRRKSFTFVIPYLNDRNHILVRRVVDRSEQLDDSFSSAQPPEKLREFEFRKQLPEVPDPIALACADMINDMINTVAISCSENSFISIDPDAARGATPDISPIKEELAVEGLAKTGSKLTANKPQPQRRPNKQMRLAKELRRLNATIIDAAAIAKDANKPCIKDHCQLGCLCESLAGELPTREHCGRADCVLSCRCTGAELTRIMRVETDGRGLSNEDAFNLRRKATARLAKMEKDFTSTLVLTDNETLLINETQCDKKRRCTKAPKRYEDFDDSIEDDEEMVRPSKAAKREISLKRARGSTESINLSPCSVKDTDFEQLKHCQVSLRRLPDVANLATFCMTHQLYKCFCGGLATEGKPIVIDKEQAELPIPHYVPELATRAHYSFERPPEEPQSSKKRRKEKPQPQQQQQQLKLPQLQKQVQLQKQPPQVIKIIPPKPAAPSALPVQPPPPPAPKACAAVAPTQRPAELDIIFSYYRSRPSLCRRAVSVPRNCYLRLNRRRAKRMRSEVARAETLQTQELLEKRVISAVRYYRSELDQQRRLELQILAPEMTVIEVGDDSDESETNRVATIDMARKRSANESTCLEEQPKRKKQLTADQNQSLIQPAPKLDIQMPKISACYSLNTNAAIDAAMGSNESSAVAVNEDSPTVDSISFRTSYNDVIKKMNTHVSKKMQDIDLALQRESKIIPAPNEEILCIIKWTNFLAAFESSYVFIWDVQMKNYSFLAATITNMMPAVCGAIAVVNTHFAPDRNALPLMARMLLEGKRNDNTSRLAVVMQGRQQYWLVKGFLRYMEGNACTKPTPQTHPILTKKINVLCTLMVKQRIREQQRHQRAAAAAAAKPGEDTGLLSIKGASPATATPPTPPETPTAVPALPAPAAATTAASTVLAPVTSTPAPTATVAAARATFNSATESKEPTLNICSNIEFRKVVQTDVTELQMPEMYTHDHRWLVLNLYDDFSHIFVPAFKDMISLDRIHNVVRVAHDTEKIVKLQFFQDAPYDAFVTPSSRRKIYFGPLRLDMQPPVLVLLQSVDGKMMLREVYQRDHNIPVQRDRRTMAFWLLQINGQVHFDIDLAATSASTKLNRSEPIAEQLQQGQDTDDDDDCVIVINDDEDDAAKEDPLVKEQTKQQQQQTHEQSVQRINFTIQSTPNNGGGLQITAASPHSAGGVKELHTSTLPGGFVPFIANVPATGGTAPATQFLTPQVQLTQTAGPAPAPPSAVASSEANAQPPPPKISRISVQRCAAPATATTVGATTKDSPPTKINNTLQQLLSSGNGNIKIGTSSTGVTITKMKNKDGSAAAAPAVEPIKIGAKRKTQELPTQPAAIPIGQPSILKQTATTISIGNLPPVRQVRPPPKLAAKAQLATVRKSLPAKLPSAVEPVRTSLPGKLVMAGSTLPNESPEANKMQRFPTTVNASKTRYGFLVAKALPRFRVKMMDGKIMVKVPDEGVFSFKTCAAASAYLNRHLSRQLNFKGSLPGDWKFLPYDNPNLTANEDRKDSNATPIVIED
ncbi:uncharacterized protein ocm [Drosophila montana]|uniref:uncharacterized protein ocm n=1 Tax=Drosophila montana TaxID=40370 RepID=UPI00313D90DC